MVARADVVIEARAWLETPFHHGQHAKRVGSDCAGLIGGVPHALGIFAPDFWEREFAPYAGYARQPHDGLLVRACDAFMDRIAPASVRPGDVLAFRFTRQTQHLAIVVDHPQGFGIVHALATAKKVVEHRLDDAWRARVTHAWRMPDVED